MSVQLVEVDPRSVQHCSLLYSLLAERTAEQSISHKQMPTYDQHLVFIDSRPYKAWYFVLSDGVTVGSVYLTRQKEIGIAIFQSYRGNGFAKEAIQELMKQHDGPFLANISPGNWPSRCLFDDLGFKFIQVTYSHD
jgi:RimJ/RimL family protein N-acetyltransferase